jgi:hypothetical protein
MESRKVPPRLWWKEDEAGAEAEKVAVGAEGPRGRRKRRPVISARWRRISPARRHMIFGWWAPWNWSGNRYGLSILGSRCRPTVRGGAGKRASLRGRRRRRRGERKGCGGDTISPLFQKPSSFVRQRWCLVQVNRAMGSPARPCLRARPERRAQQPGLSPFLQNSRSEV